jgi:hypothetical protein
MAALVNNVSAQIPDVTDKNGCIWDTGVQGENYCVGCGQEMPDESGFCQAEGCPRCWEIVFDHHDENLGTDIYKLTIEPDGGSPTIIYVYNINQFPVASGWKITYTEI